MIPISYTEMICPETYIKEERKIAKVLGSGDILSTQSKGTQSSKSSQSTQKSWFFRIFFISPRQFPFSDVCEALIPKPTDVHRVQQVNLSIFSVQNSV